MLKMPITPREIICFSRYVCKCVSDLWRGMASRKSVTCVWIKKLDVYAFKNKKKPSVGVELRAGGDPHRSEKPGWSAGDMRSGLNKKKIHRHSVSPTSVAFFWLVIIFGLFKVSKMTNYDLPKVSNITNFNYDLFKVSKMTILIMTCSKSAKWLWLTESQQND